MRNKKRIFYVTIASATALLLSACGSSDTNWGIDHGGIPQCTDDINDSSVSIEVRPYTKVKALAKNTSIRVWHYSDSNKLVCVLTGKASISKGEIR